MTLRRDGHWLTREDNEQLLAEFPQEIYSYNGEDPLPTPRLREIHIAPDFLLALMKPQLYPRLVTPLPADACILSCRYEGTDALEGRVVLVVISSEFDPVPWDSPPPEQTIVFRRGEPPE